MAQINVATARYRYCSEPAGSRHSVQTLHGMLSASNSALEIAITVLNVQTHLPGTPKIDEYLGYCTSVLPALGVFLEERPEKVFCCPRFLQETRLTDMEQAC